MQHKSFNDTWYDWESLGGEFIDGVAASSWASYRLDCFAVGSDFHTLKHKWYDGSWHEWMCRGGELYSAPAAVSWDSQRIDVFAIGENKTMQHKWYHLQLNQSN
ncbi:putative sialidase [Methanosarcina barkeri 3]|uniref:Sialidase n=2 Tax=Methanosarcina barkeri TaxID=2208 RepID=A0A0E3SJG5_METBA|nr:putative sialidase [Methanosarcina barkeri 3]